MVAKATFIILNSLFDRESGTFHTREHVVS
jgi:hypothetical protein